MRMESDLHPRQTLRTRHFRCGHRGEQDAPGAHAAPVGAINKFGSQASGASRADGCQRWPDRGGAGITLRVQPREPCFHPPHFGTGLDAVGPAFSGRDRVRDTTTHLMRTRYLRIRGPARAPHVPKGPPLAQPSGHPPSRPGPVGPAARVAGGHGNEYAAGGRGRGKLAAAVQKKHRSPSGLTGGPI